MGHYPPNPPIKGEETPTTNERPTFRATIAEPSSDDEEPPTEAGDPPAGNVGHTNCQHCGDTLHHAVLRQRGTCGPCYLKAAS